MDAADIRMPLHRFAGTIRRNKHCDDRAHDRLQNPLAQNDVRAGEPSRRWEARWNKWKGQGNIRFYPPATRRQANILHRTAKTCTSTPSANNFLPPRQDSAIARANPQWPAIGRTGSFIGRHRQTFRITPRRSRLAHSPAMTLQRACKSRSFELLPNSSPMQRHPG